MTNDERDAAYERVRKADAKIETAKRMLAEGTQELVAAQKDVLRLTPPMYGPNAKGGSDHAE
jgi:hypothetical protein